MPGVMTGTPLMATDSLASLEAQLNSLTGELQRLRSENASLEADITRLQTESAQQTVARRGTLTTQIADTQRAIATEQTRHDTLQSTRNGLVSPTASSGGSQTVRVVPPSRLKERAALEP